MVGIEARLPYPGFSWSFNQHNGTVVAEPLTMFALLEAAHTYSASENAEEQISRAMVERNLLPPNIRGDAGRPQIWRDYQQVLSELGLVVSTRFTRGRIIVTPMGLMLLDGSIGFSELITTQALRYQYPNGHKWQVSARLRDQLDSHHVPVPESRARLDERFGVQVKPAVLLLRILVELAGQDPNPTLTARECAAALLEVKRNGEWRQGLAGLLGLRRRWREPTVDPASLRHIQEWFRFLGFSDLFHSARRGVLSLSPYACQDLGTIRRVCEHHEDPGSFWLPPGGTVEAEALSWFNYYGVPDVESEWLMPPAQLTSSFVDDNYPGGMAEADVIEEPGRAEAWEPGIELRRLQEMAAERGDWRRAGLIRMDPDRQRLALERLERNARLHQRIVQLAAARLRERGFTVQEDPQSVDLFAARGGVEAILEVKTVTRRSMRGRMRLGVGQLSEYRYRRALESHTRPKGVLVLSSRGTFPNWILSYFQDELHLGLVSLSTADTFLAHTTGALERVLA